MKFKKILNLILCLAMTVTMVSTGAIKVHAVETPVNTNLALTKPVVTNLLSVNDPSFLTDGKIETRMTSSIYDIKPSVDDPFWAYVDLGSVQEMNYFSVVWESDSNYAKDFKIYTTSEETINDNTQWTLVKEVTNNTSGRTSEIELEKSVSGRYIKLEVTAVTGYPNVSACEFIVMLKGISTPVNTNLALEKPINASAEYPSLPAKNLVDGKENTRWSAEAAAPQSVVIDLEESYQMNYFSILWEGGNFNMIGASYNIYVSDDTNNWGSPVVAKKGNTEVKSIDTLKSPVSGQYVKLEVTEVTGNYSQKNVSAYEFEIMLKDDSEKTPQNPQENVALNKKGYSSSNETAGLTADKAFDGNTSTKDSRWSSKQGNAPHWIFVDLGEERDIKTIRLYWETRKATKYRIQVADTVTDTATGDGNWKDVATLNERPNSKTDTITLPNVQKGRYVRLYIDSFTALDPDSSESWNTISIYEMEVYGGVPAISMNDIGNMIRVESPAKGSTKLNVTLPEVEGYEVTYNGTDLEQVIDEDLTIYTPIVDKTVKVSFKIVNTETKAYEFKEIPVTVPGKNTVETNDNKALKVLPELQEWKGRTGEFIVSGSSRIIYEDDTLKNAAEEMKADYEALTGKTIEVVKGTKSDVNAGDFFFEKTADTTLGLKDEGYLMEINDSVTVTSETQTGAYWATRTILQALKQNDYVSIPKGITRDYPLYKVRGFILDVGRKTFTLDYLKQLVKQMSWYKMNDFQVHLNDNLIPLEKYSSAGLDPMNAYSAFRLENDTVKKGNVLVDTNGDPVQVNGKEQVYQNDLTSTDLWYTKEEFKNFIKESRALGVNIVPEIDTPAHSLALTRVLPDLRLGTWGRQNDHLDLVKSYEQCLTFVKTIFNEYLEGTDPVFDSDTIVHIGADEYNASSVAYRKFVNDMIEYVRDTKQRVVRVWGSFSAAAKGDAINTVADDGTRVQINLWNFSYAKMNEMYENGFDLINCNDGNYYIVPNAGYYSSGKISDGNMYNLDINKISNVTIPAGDKQMIGGAFAVWNDMTDYLDNGVSEYDVYSRISNLSLFAAKLWGKGELNLNEANVRSSELGDAPRTNFGYKVDSETDEYMNLAMDELKDSSENKFIVSEGENASLVEVDGKKALELKGSTSYITTNLETVGLGSDLRVKVKRTSASTEEQILFESPYGSIKAVQAETGKVGLSRERFNYSFNYTLPLNEWVELEFKNELNTISLYVNGEKVDTLGDGEKIQGRPLLATMMFPMAVIGSKTNAFIGFVDDVRIGKSDDFSSTMSLDYALWNASTVIRHESNNDLALLIAKGKELLKEYDPSEEEITRLTNEINAIVDTYDYEKANYNRIRVYRSLVEDLSAFTDESAATVTRILNSIRDDLPVELQTTVDGYEHDLLSAIEKLETKPLTNLYFIDQSTMKATASSNHTDGSTPDKVLDGNTSTIWHTLWSDTEMPHWIDLEFSEPTEIKGLIYTPRQSGNNGNVTEYEIQVMIGDKYQTIKKGTLQNNSDVKTIEFEPAITTHIRLVYVKAVNNNGSAAELQVVRANINADIEGLKAAIQEAEELLDSFNKADFVEETWNGAEQLLANAKVLVSSDDPDANEVAQTIYDISKKITELRLGNIDMSDLNALIKEAESLSENEYTAESWKMMQEKLAAAKKVADNKYSSQTTVNLAITELEDALKQLVKVEKTQVDKTELQKKLNEAKAINTSRYTKESVSALDKAMADAEKVLTDESATQDEVGMVVKALEDAVNGLQKLTDSSTESKAPSTNDNSMLGVYIGLLSVSMAAIFVFLKKRKQEMN